MRLQRKFGRFSLTLRISSETSKGSEQPVVAAMGNPKKS